MIKVLIFTLPTCAPCNALKEDMKGKEFDADIQMINMNDADDETVNLSVKYNVRSAPTVVVIKENGTTYFNGTMVRTSEKLVQLIEEAKG